MGPGCSAVKAVEPLSSDILDGRKRAQDAALRGPGAQGDDTGGVVAHPHRLGSVGEEVQQPVTQGGVEAKGAQFAHQKLQDDGVEHQAEVQKQHSHMCVPPFWRQCGPLPVSGSTSS